MANYLWGFNNNVTGTSSATPNAIDLPTITPAGKTSNNYSTQSTSTQTSLVNVVRDFYWTYSPVGDTARAEVPRIILTERKLRTNALISQLKYSLGQVMSGGKQTLQNLQQFGSSTGVTAAAQNAGNKLSQFLAGLPGANAVTAGAESAASTASGLVTDGASRVGGVIANNDTIQQGIVAAKTAGAQVADALGRTFADDNNPTVNSSPWLAPYRNLYLTDPTGWVYVLPYFNNNQANQSNSFSDSGQTGIFSDKVVGAAAAGLVNEAAGLMASLNSPAQITYIEKTKFYNYPTDGEDITVEFPLINTGSVTYDDVVRNWQFLFLLLYQNRPGKTSQNTVDQPVIYQVEVPGVKFFPFCYITSLNIEFVGSRRELNINVPTSSSISSDVGNLGQSLNTASGSVSIPAVIPDAYKVTISLKSMIANSKNFMQHMIGPHQLVEAGVSTGTGSVTNATGGTLTTGINVTPANGILNGLV